MIEKRKQSIRDAKSFCPFHEFATDGLHCLLESQERQRQRPQALTAILAEAREGIREKEGHVTLMEFDEDLEDVLKSGFCVLVLYYGCLCPFLCGCLLMNLQM